MLRSNTIPADVITYDIFAILLNNYNTVGGYTVVMDLMSRRCHRDLTIVILRLIDHGDSCVMAKALP